MAKKKIELPKEEIVYVTDKVLKQITKAKLMGWRRILKENKDLSNELQEILEILEVLDTKTAKEAIQEIFHDLQILSHGENKNIHAQHIYDSLITTYSAAIQEVEFAANSAAAYVRNYN